MKALLVLISLVIICAPAQSQPLTAVGSEFQVNDVTNLGQFDSRVTYDAVGGFVVVWASGSSGGDDTGSYSIQMRRHDSSGAPIGAQFQVNDFTTGYQSLPDIAEGGALGDFFVVWRSNDDSVDTDGRSIKARRFTSDGQALGGEFLVNNYTTGQQSAPRVAVDGTGQAVAVWSSEGSLGNDSDRDSIQARLYSENGNAVGDAFQVNTYTTSAQSSPAIDSTVAGDFVVAWTSTGSPGDDSDDQSIQARLFFSDGSPNGDQFQVNTFTTFRQQQVAVAMHDDGQFLVAWSSSQSIDDNDNSIQARRFDSSGAPIGDQFRVNAYTTSFQRAPAVTTAPGGGFLVVWDSGQSVNDNNLTSVQAQLFDDTGLPLGDQQQVNTFTQSFQFDGGVAWDGEDGFVVAWTSYGSSGNDSSEGSIQGQRFEAIIALFEDGFESGDTSAWSEIVP